jgi:hypothetical protein
MLKFKKILGLWVLAFIWSLAFGIWHYEARLQASQSKTNSLCWVPCAWFLMLLPFLLQRS